MTNKTKSSQIEFSPLFNKRLEEKHLQIKTAFRETLEIFLEEPENPILRNHLLNKEGKKYFGLWSINITGDWRAIYRKKGRRIIFIDLGTHKDLYKKS